MNQYNFIKLTYRLLLILSGIQYSSHGYSQTEFIIHDTLFLEDYDEVKQDLFLKKDSLFFEDESYSVRRSCSGEFGGSVWFKSKASGIEYSSSAICPVVINKLNGKYYVTASLAHLMGITEVIEIVHPDSMEVFKKPAPAGRKGKQEIYRVGDLESRSRAGTKTLLDSAGVLIVLSFPYEKELFHIVSTYHHTFLCQIKDSQLVTLDTIAKERLPIDYTQLYKSKNNTVVMLFESHLSKGYIEIDSNLIGIRRFE